MSITPSWRDVVVFTNVAYDCVATGGSVNGNWSTPDGSGRGDAAAPAGAPVADGEGSAGGVAPSVGAGAGVAGDSVEAACGAATGSTPFCACASETVATRTASKATE